METTPNPNSPLVPVVVTTERTMHNIEQLTNINGTVYFVGDTYTGKGSELYKLDANGQPVLVAEINTSFNGSNIDMITNVNGIIYFDASDGTQQGLYRIDPSTGTTSRVGNMIINTGNGGPSGNIVNIGNSDYFLANNGDKQLWKIDRTSGALSKVTPNGLPTNFLFDIEERNSGNNFRVANNSLAIGDNLYFRGNGQVWKFDPITNNSSPIQIPNQPSYAPGEFHQVGNALFFKTNSRSSGQELYKIDANSGAATLVSDPIFTSSNYRIDDNNFVDVNGTLHFTTNDGHEIWKLDATGQAVLAATINGASISNEPSNFTNVNGTLCFAFDDGTNHSQIWKLKSDGTVARITSLAPNATYGTTSVGNLTAIGDRLYFTANDAQYGGELRELDIMTGNVSTLDLSPGLYGSSPGSSYLESKIINVNGTPYFASSVHPDGASYLENRIFKLAPAGTVTPTPTPTPTPIPNPNSPGQLTTATGDGGLNVTVGKTGSFSGAAYDPIGVKTASSTTFESNVAFRIGDTGERKFISTLATNITSSTTDTATSTSSSFLVAGLQFELVQTVSDLNKNEQRTGSGLTQTYQITNSTNAAISFELVRYFDGDLQFDGSIADKGGRIARNGRDILFETDSGDNPSSPTTFVGITANGGNTLASNRYEIGQYSSLRSRILAGDPLTNSIQGDTNGDSFIDSAPYDVTPAFRNTFSLAAGATTTYVTETLFGTGVPTQVSLPETITVAATDANAFENNGDTATFTLTRANANATKAITVNYTLSGAGISGTDYTSVSGSVTFLAGQNTATVTVNPIADNIEEEIESVVLTIENGSGYNLSDRSRQARITIADDNSVSNVPTIVSIDSVSFTEGNAGTKNAVFNVTLNQASEVEVTVDVSTVNGTAIAGEDYTALDKTTIYFAPGETTQQVTVAILGDRTMESDEAFAVNLSDPTNATLNTDSSVIATVVNDDIPISIAVSDADVAETKSGETSNHGQFVITRSGDLSQSLSVKYTLSGTSTNSDDYHTLTGTSIFAAGVDQAFVDINSIDDSIYEGAESVTFSVSTEDYLVTGANSVTATIADNDAIDPKLIEPAQNLLAIEGGTVKSLLKFSKVSQQGNNRNEVLAFVVDDDLGSINGIKPGESGYIAAALDRAQSIFSNLGNSEFDKQHDRNSQRYLNFTPGQRIEFVEIINDTLDGVKSDLAAGESTSNLLFSLPEANASGATEVKFNFIASDNSYEINFNDLVIKVETLDNFDLPIGTALQTQSEGQLIDLRVYGGLRLADTKTIGDAAYNNYIGFYEVADEQGTLTNGLKPGDAGYVEAAVREAILTTRFKSQVDSNLSVPGGKILAPVVIANGTFDDFLNKNPENKADSNVHAYFNYLGANTDKVDHFRSLGDNKFGVEDLYGGGDRDYNDLIFQVNIKA